MGSSIIKIEIEIICLTCVSVRGVNGEAREEDEENGEGGEVLYWSAGQQFS